MSKAVWVFRADREVFDAVEKEAALHDLSPNEMLNKIVKDWFGGTIPKREDIPDKKDEKPWFLK